MIRQGKLAPYCNGASLLYTEKQLRGIRGEVRKKPEVEYYEI